MKTSPERVVAVLESWGGDGGTWAAQAEHLGDQITLMWCIPVGFPLTVSQGISGSMREGETGVRAGTVQGAEGIARRRDECHWESG